MFDCQKCGACCLVDAEHATNSTADQLLYVNLTDEDLHRMPTGLRRRYAAPEAMRYAMKVKGHEDGFACAAFEGRVGGACSCCIYDDRPTVCREFNPGNEACLGARQAHGLPIE